MNKNLVVRIVFTLLGIAVIFGGVQISKRLSSQKEPPKMRTNATIGIVPVDVLYAQNGTVKNTLNVQGTLVAFDKIQIFSEVSGILEETSRPFKEGSFFKKGDILARINEDEARYNLNAQKSALVNAITQFMPDLKIDYKESFKNWQQYLNEFDVEAPIKPFPQPVSEQEKYFIASKNIHNQYFNIKSAETRLSKHVIYAPFDGVLTTAAINPGALVRAGQTLGELMNTSNYELEATVPLSELKTVKIGSQVKLFSSDIMKEWNGQVKRISNQIDANTQNVKIFISATGQDLREGMYLKGEVDANSFEKALSLPRELLIDQKAVYIVQDSVLRLQEVQVLKITSDIAVVKGIENGAMLLNSKIASAFDGMKVRIKQEDKVVRDNANTAASTLPSS